MRRLVLYFLIAVLAVSLHGVASAAQEGTPQSVPASCDEGRMPSTPESEQLMEVDQNDYLAWEGVCRPIDEGQPIPPSPPNGLPSIIGQAPLPEELQADLDAALDPDQGNPDLVFQPYDVTLVKEWATIPLVGPAQGEEIESEFMVVVVRQGSFVLDLGLDAQQSFRPVYVTTPDPSGSITVMNPWTMSTPKPHYSSTGDVLQNEDGSTCTTYCEVIPGQPVRLEMDDFAIAARGALCTYCLEQSAIDENGIHGLIEVYPLMDPGAIPDGFSWVQSWDRINVNGEIGSIDEPARLGWSLAILATGCKDH